MTSWSGFAEIAPELAAAVEGRFDSHRHALLATLRRDGAPRISGIEVHVFDGELWLGMMPDSVKGSDLKRDPRFSLHSAPIDLEMADGDAKIQGRAVLVDDRDTIAAFAASLSEALPPGEMELFRANIADASVVRVDMEAQLLVIDSWREGDAAPRQRKRR
jgi:hypothetical protein